MQSRHVLTKVRKMMTQSFIFEAIWGHFEATVGTKTDFRDDFVELKILAEKRFWTQCPTISGNSPESGRAKKNSSKQGVESLRPEAESLQDLAV